MEPELKNTKIGICFEFSKEYVDHLGRLFRELPVSTYTWYVACSENYYSLNGTVDLFLPDGVYSWDEFLSVLRATPEYYIRLLRLLAVPADKSLDQSTIHSYADYVQSNAEIALLSADSYVDFYAKDTNVLDAVMKSCRQYYSSGELPCYITPENDERTGFWV